MKKWISIISLLSLWLGLLSPIGVYATEAEEGNQQAVVEKMQEFASLVRPSLEASEEGNQLFSPMSFYLALTALDPALEGEHQEQLGQVLVPEDMEREDYYAILAELLKQATTAENPAFNTLTYALANEEEVWAQEYLDAVQDILIETQNVNFSDQATYQALNEEIADFTNDLIDPYFSEERINELIANQELHLMLLNMLYFKSDWVSQFNEAATTLDTFHGRDGDSEVDMMSQKAVFSYFETDQYTALRLPYQNDASLLVVMAKEDVSDEEKWAFYQEALSYDGEWESQEIKLVMPKWEASQSLDLMDSLDILGLGSFADDLGETHFFESKDPIAISQILQRIEFKLDEFGTEAAAVTEIIMEKTSLPVEEPEEIRIDRPFVYGIEYMGMPLFEGLINNIASGQEL